MIHAGSRNKKNVVEQATPLEPPNPIVGAVAPPPEAYPAPGRSTRKFLVSFGVDPDDLSGSRKKRNNDEANDAGVESSGLEMVVSTDTGHIHADKRRKL